MEWYFSKTEDFLELPGLSLVTSSRQEKVHRLRRPEDKTRCLVAGLLLRTVLSVTHDSDLEKSSHGKLYMHQGNQFFNLSHSGEYVILATDETEVGADVEKLRPWSGAVATRCFTESELKWLDTQDGEDGFFKLWTAKESVMKASGLGFSLSPNSFSVLPIDSVFHPMDENGYYLYWYSFPGHQACIASQSDHWSEPVQLTRAELLN